MQVISYGQPVIPKRLTFAEVVGTDNRPLQKPLNPRRVKITAPSAIRGVAVYVGSVFEFDIALADGREDYGCLVGSNKAVVVPITTPLHVEAEPKPEPVIVPKESPEHQLGALLSRLLKKG
jgi:hypothetical protein